MGESSPAKGMDGHQEERVRYRARQPPDEETMRRLEADLAAFQERRLLEIMASKQADVIIDDSPEPFVPHTSLQVSTIRRGPKGHTLTFLLSDMDSRAEMFLAYLGPWWGCRQLRFSCRHIRDLVNPERRKGSLQYLCWPQRRQARNSKAYTWEEFEGYYRERYSAEAIEQTWNKLTKVPHDAASLLDRVASPSRLAREYAWLEVQRNIELKRALTCCDAPEAVWFVLVDKPLHPSRLWVLQLLADLDVDVEEAISANLQRWCDPWCDYLTELSPSCKHDLAAFLSKKAPAVLCKAAQYNWYSVTSLMLEARADPNVRTVTNRRTPLMLAAAGGHKNIGYLLFDHGANPDLQDAYGRTAEQLCGTEKTRKWFRWIKMSLMLPRSSRILLQNTLIKVAHARERPFLFFTWKLRCRRRWRS
eukprot:TRINITY_DN55624_c0_g1_i1.p1 TRINITY_DN55624_c0_g1~~TRINITY_DN55624_c0_g1_i1.p1  ORF type:complete len:419 (+),score=34.88 TRINITY_DN55624_c0_g1_i1:51-1307(+)